MDKEIIKEYIALLRNVFAEYIPGERKSLGNINNINPRFIYLDTLNKIENEINKIQ